MKILSIALASTLFAGASAQSANLVADGDFNQGGSWVETGSPSWEDGHYSNAGFTSDYKARNAAWGNSLWSEGTYVIGTNPSYNNGNFLTGITDQGGDGYMLIVNGATGANAANDVVWQTSVTGLAAGVDYSFTAFVRNINDQSKWGGDLTAWKNSQAQLQFQVFDLALNQWVSLGNEIDLTDPLVDANAWTSVTNIWNSGVNLSAEIRLLNLQTAASGNDFALDSISFQPQAVPEPSSLVLLGVAGAAGVASWLRRRR